MTHVAQSESENRKCLNLKRGVDL